MDFTYLESLTKGTYLTISTKDKQMIDLNLAIGVMKVVIHRKFNNADGTLPGDIVILTGRTYPMYKVSYLSEFPKLTLFFKPK